jgi:hypothetical protein
VNDLATIGAALRYRGLSGRALSAWATPRLSALAHVLPSLPPAEGNTAGALLELFVAGRALALARLHALDLESLHRADLIDVAGGEARARVSVLPLAGSLLVCDRLDAPADRELACWPDDSSYHLALALPPGPHLRWLDLGCGSGFAPLMRPQLAEAIGGADLSARAVKFAKLGAGLSDVTHFTAYAADLADGVPEEWRGACQLVSCNAPIPDADVDPYRPMWRASDSDFVARLYGQAAQLVAPGGSVVVHAAEDALAHVIGELPGERVVITYTPQGMRQFAIAWWRPHAVPRLIAIRHELTAQSPHLTYSDYEATAR